MNRPNDDAIREGYERFNRGYFDGWLEFLDPEVELREEYLAPDAGVHHGHAGVRQWLVSGGQAIGGVQFEIGRFVADTPNATVVEVIASGRGVESGAAFRTRLFHLMRWRNNRIVLLASYGEEDEALEAAGLSR